MYKVYWSIFAQDSGEIIISYETFERAVEEAKKLCMMNCQTYQIYRLDTIVELVDRPTVCIKILDRA